MRKINFVFCIISFISTSYGGGYFVKHKICEIKIFGVILQRVMFRSLWRYVSFLNGMVEQKILVLIRYKEN